MISHDSSGSVVKDLGVQYEVPDLNAGNFFNIFMYFFVPCGDCSIRVFNPTIYSKLLIFTL